MIKIVVILPPRYCLQTEKGLLEEERARTNFVPHLAFSSCS